MTQNKICVGWREWVALPEFGIDAIKAKVDTGARTSCIHCFKVEAFDKGGKKWVRFWLHPEQEDETRHVVIEAPVEDERIVTDSGGHKESRFVIVTEVRINGKQWPIEMTLTNRDNMKFRMLLGRTAMNDRIIVDPAQSFLTDNEGAI